MYRASTRFLIVAIAFLAPTAALFQTTTPANACAPVVDPCGSVTSDGNGQPYFDGRLRNNIHYNWSSFASRNHHVPFITHLTSHTVKMSSIVPTNHVRFR